MISICGRIFGNSFATRHVCVVGASARRKVEVAMGDRHISRKLKERF